MSIRVRARRDGVMIQATPVRSAAARRSVEREEILLSGDADAARLQASATSSRFFAYACRFRCHARCREMMPHARMPCPRAAAATRLRAYLRDAPRHERCFPAACHAMMPR